MLLRGVNVGGNNRLPMAELRADLARRGYDRVETYIASGNVALDAAPGSGIALAEDLAAAVIERFGLRIAVVVRTGEELRATIAGTPFAGHLEEPGTVHVGFAQGAIATSAIAPRAGSIDEIVVRGRELHLYCPDGLGRSRLPDLDRAAGTPITVRNWNTVVRLLAMTQA